MVSSQGKVLPDNRTVIWGDSSDSSDSSNSSNSSGGVEVRPGDTLRLSCDFDTRGRGEVTTFGPTAREEMCQAFLNFYRFL